MVSGFGWIDLCNSNGISSSSLINQEVKENDVFKLIQSNLTGRFKMMILNSRYHVWYKQLDLNSN